MTLAPDRRDALLRLLDALLDQQRARVVVPPTRAADGFWFGGGDLVPDDDGSLWLTGRFRDAGDSRTGVAAGVRGRELAIFRSRDDGASFEKVRAWSKAELAVSGDAVLSIEGTSLQRRDDGAWELFVSMERRRAYPEPYAAYQKPGTGVWSIERTVAERPEALEAADLEPALQGDEDAHLHVKDPVARAVGAGTALLFSNHPLSWASSNSGLAIRPPGAGAFEVQAWEVVPRGPVWDVGATRLTEVLPVPRVGRFAGGPPVSVLLYDGAEAMRPLEESRSANARPRGYSCEELGGAMWTVSHEFAAAERLTPIAPRYLSPHGSRSSRYAKVATLPDGGLIATWQQAQADGSQPLVMHRLSAEQVAEALR